MDDRYDDSRKVKRAWRAHPRAVGLHAMAITYCSRHETDGLVDPDWLTEKLPVERERVKVLRAMVDVGMFTEEANGFYRVHDYLDYNPSHEALEAKRRRDAARKAGKAAGGIPADSEQLPHGFRVESDTTPAGIPAASRGGAGAGAHRRSPSRPVPSQPDPARPDARGLSELVDDVENILAQSERLPRNRVGVENAIAAWPGRDPVLAAYTVITWVTDPAFRTTNTAKLLGDALSKQQPKPASDAKAERTARRLASLEALGGNHAA